MFDDENLSPSSASLRFPRIWAQLLCRRWQLIVPVVGISWLTYWLLCQVHLVLFGLVGLGISITSLATVLAGFQRSAAQIRREFHNEILERVLFIRQQGTLPDALIDDARPPKNLEDLVDLSHQVESLLPAARARQWQTRIDWLKAYACNKEVWKLSKDHELYWESDRAWFYPPSWLAPTFACIAMVSALVLLGLDIYLSVVGVASLGGARELVAIVGVSSFFVSIAFGAFTFVVREGTSYTCLYRRMHYLARFHRLDVPVPEYTESYAELRPTLQWVDIELRNFSEMEEQAKVRENWMAATGDLSRD